ncbi:hypothetical protein F8388_017602 [Cannabis sativa]|uniref:Small ribosomal subunit protein mS23 n=3 Tax=Cannabis sativa TaxID=3483 RepID=A0A7J6DVA8_CANSA|nr:hypothetical protein F8388_017602 [Cannabis sativa]
MHTSKWVLVDCIRRCNNWRSFKQIHAHLLTTGLVYNDDLITNTIVDYFGKTTAAFVVDYACDFFKHLDSRSSSFPFNTLISGYAGRDMPREGVLVYRRLVRDGFVPDTFTFPPLLKSCTKSRGIGEGRQFHAVIFNMGFSSHVYVLNSLVHMYSVCGDCKGASAVFDEMLVRDAVSWSCLISGFVKTELFDEAIALFLKMEVEPNMATFVSVLVACGRKGYLRLGKGIHGLSFKRPVDTPLLLGNALMDMYVKCEHLCEAKQTFDELSERDVVSWTCVISGLVQSEHPKGSLELFCEMQQSGIEPDKIILTSVLSACASLGALDYGRWVHEYIDRSGIKWDIQIGTAMMDMYAKCGCIKMALQIFNEMPRRNIVTWNALLSGLAMNGQAHEALGQFKEMTRSNVRPNEVTFLAILTACGHSGLVDEGRTYFHQMMREPYNVSPRLEHYGCMVDLLCRAGLLDEAQKLIKSMPMQADVLIWGALLSACKTFGNFELSHEILDGLLELESEDSGVYVLLSNIYATNEKWSDVIKVRRLMKEKGIRKAPGSSVTAIDEPVLLTCPFKDLREREFPRAAAMSFMKGDLLTKTRKLVKGLAIAEPRWLKAMELAPPPAFPRSDGKVKTITLPEDVYTNKFYKKHPNAKYEEAFDFCSFDPPPARLYGLRILDLKEQGVSEDAAMATADMEYRSEKKAKKKAYARLKQISRIQGKKPPPNPYPSAIREIQAEERKYVHERFFNPKIQEAVRQLKEEKAERFASNPF